MWNHYTIFLLNQVVFFLWRIVNWKITVNIGYLSFIFDVLLLNWLKLEVCKYIQASRGQIYKNQLRYPNSSADMLCPNYIVVPLIDWHLLFYPFPTINSNA